MIAGQSPAPITSTTRNPGVTPRPFSPAVVQARVGETVVWVNDDAPPHNVTYVSGPSFTSSPTVMKTGAKFSVKLGQAGRIRYYCTLHPWMKATIVVAP